MNFVNNKEIVSEAEATILLSGGIDSMLCAHLMCKKHYRTQGVFIDFGQPAAEHEKRAAESLTKTLSLLPLLHCMARPVIDRPILISAYDIFHEKIRQPNEPVGLLFLDSGGYEASKDGDLSDYGDYTYYPQPWGQKDLQKVIAGWNSPEPTVFVSYDHPIHRLPMADQICQAREILPINPLSVKEILIKPENVEHRFLDIAAILPHAAKLAEFDIIGLTEKEIGRTIAERMQNIAKLRRKLDSLGAATPIHIFGSLDTFNTTLYFVSGADIFDGLTWLRFSFSEGKTIYKYVHASLKYGLKMDIDDIDPSCWFDNYHYMRQIEREMRRYVNERSFKVFSWHAENIKTAFHDIIQIDGGE